ncbi:MAG: PAS domain-containing protein, partial [Spirochaetia bacterium]|nr:PAS domain-containing protein [Spirochaetia bacterium]
ITKRLQILSEKEKRAEKSWISLDPVSVQDISANLTMPQSIRQKPVAAVAVSEEDIKTALASIGKYSRKDELNCSGCGYDSCQAFAAAMFLGKAEKTMCLSYTRKLAQKKANALLKAMPSAAVVVDSSMHIVECNKPFAELLGSDAMELYALKPSLEGADLRKLLPFWEAFEQVLMPERQDIVASDFQCNGKIVHGSVFSIEKGLLAGGLFQDITAPWIQKDRVISQARKVMSQNLRTVQKIAYLLGENAAEAESALTSIIESFQSERSSDSYKSNKE